MVLEEVQLQVMKISICLLPWDSMPRPRPRRLLRVALGLPEAGHSEEALKQALPSDKSR